MKCPECGGTGYAVYPMMSMNGDEYTGEWEQHECEFCNGTGEVRHGMTHKTLTAGKAIAIHREAQKAKKNGAVEYKRYLKQVIEDYGIEKNDAVQIALGKNMLKIVAKYEAKRDANGMEMR